jgi:hypothetical protein
MPRFAIAALAAALILGGCARSVYDELARYKNEATPADAELQACLDAYSGRLIRIGEGYGDRLPFDSEETGELLRRAARAEEELEGVEAPESARPHAEDKIAAAEDIRAAFELLDGVTREWENRLPTGPLPGADTGTTCTSTCPTCRLPGPPVGDVEVVELAPGDAERWRDDMARVDRAFEVAERAFDDAALALGAAILRAHDEEK